MPSYERHIREAKEKLRAEEERLLQLRRKIQKSLQRSAEVRDRLKKLLAAKPRKTA